MVSIFYVVFTILSLFAAVYAHYRLPFHSATRNQLWLARMILVGVGFLFGLVVAMPYASEEPATQAFIFLGGLGVVHIPAAVILFIKHQRKKQTS